MPSGLAAYLKYSPEVSCPGSVPCALRDPGQISGNIRQAVSGIGEDPVLQRLSRMVLHIQNGCDLPALPLHRIQVLLFQIKIQIRIEGTPNGLWRLILQEQKMVHIPQIPVILAHNRGHG